MFFFFVFKNKEVLYPRDPLIYSMSAPQLRRNFKYPPRLVNQHNLREQTKFKLYFPKENIKDMKPELPAEDKREYFSSNLYLIFVFF